MASRKFPSAFNDIRHGFKASDPTDWVDVCDHLTPSITPDGLIQQFGLSDTDLVDLTDERPEDFANDLYDYDDISEYGQDIADLASLHYSSSKPKSKLKR